MKVGFIGLGIMGASMAANLQKAGFALVVHDIRGEAAKKHLANGAIWAESPRAVAEAAELVFTSLPAPPDVEKVALGENGLLSGMKPGGTLFDLSTNAQSVVRRIHDAFAAKGCEMMDAPVSGGPAGAASGKLAIWVGGKRAVFDRYRKQLDAIGDQASYVGPIGQATVAKLVHNCAGYAIQAALSEVFSMGVKAGLDPVDLWAAVRQGALGRSRTFDRLADRYLPAHYDPPAFALRLAHKDMSLATALGKELGVPMRIANMALEEMTEALGRGWGDRDSRSPMLIQNERAGVEIKADPARIKAVFDRDGR